VLRGRFDRWAPTACVALRQCRFRTGLVVPDGFTDRTTTPCSSRHHPRVISFDVDLLFEPGAVPKDEVEVDGQQLPVLTEMPVCHMA
jgi:hypothetical protein